MKPIKLTLALILAGTGTAVAQTGVAEYQQMQARMEQAQADANRPGDERLDCAALEKEMIGVATDPALKDQVAKLGKQAEDDRARIDAGMSQMSIQTAMTVYASLMPGGAWAQLGAAQANMPAQRTDTNQRVDRIREDSQAMMRFLPQIMRGQRVFELAQQRQCAWVIEGMKAH